MTGQELKGKILFIAIIITIIVALFSGHFTEALYLIGVLILGVIAYQIIGRLFLGITGGRFDPFNIKGEDLFPEKKQDPVIDNKKKPNPIIDNKKK